MKPSGRTDAIRIQPLFERQEVGRVLPPHRLRFASRYQPLLRILAQRLRQPVSLRPSSIQFGNHQRFPNQARKQVQDVLRKKDPAKYGKVYGVGMTESSRATDTLYNFEMALLSFNGAVMDADGKIVADQPKNREAIIKTLAWFGDLFNSGYVPPDTLSW